MSEKKEITGFMARFGDEELGISFMVVAENMNALEAIAIEYGVCDEFGLDPNQVAPVTVSQAEPSHLLCKHCKKADVEKVAACEPYSSEHWQCPSCDGTYPEWEYTNSTDT